MGMMPAVKKNKISKREIAYEKLRDAIIFGEMKPGEKITERATSEMLKIGTTPIREAIRQLQSEGLVDVSTNKGAKVKRLNIKDLRDAYDTASLLESYAVEEATRLITSPQKKKIRSFLSEMTSAGNNKDYRAYVESNRLFHSYFHQILGNAILSEHIENVRNRFARVGGIMISQPAFWEKSLNGHNEILDCVLGGRSKKAGKYMKNHLHEVKEMITGFLKTNPWM